MKTFYLSVILLFSGMLHGQSLPFGSFPITVGTTTITEVATGQNSAASLTTSAVATAAGAIGDVIVASSKTQNNSGIPTVVFSGPTCTGGWQPLVPANSNGSGVDFSSVMYACVLSAAVTPTVTVTWAGVSGLGPFTDLSFQILHSTTAWNNPILDRATSQVNTSASTSCATGAAGTTQNPNDIWIGVCENFNVAQTAGTFTGWTNSVGATRNTVLVYDKATTATSALNVTMPLSGSDKSTGMTVALQASNNTNCSGCTVVQSALSANQTPQFDHISLSAANPGDSYVYYVVHTNWSGSGTTTMSDSGGNKWAPCNLPWSSAATSVTMTDIQYATVNGMACFYSLNATFGGTLTGLPIASDCAVSCTNIGGVFAELSGVTAYDAWSETAGASTSGSNNMNCGSITTTKANDLMICGVFAPTGTVTAGTLPATSTQFSNNSVTGSIESLVWTGSGATTQTQTLSTSGTLYGAIGVAFK